jgi:hypothetical protein
MGLPPRDIILTPIDGDELPPDEEQSVSRMQPHLRSDQFARLRARASRPRASDESGIPSFL